MKNVKAKQRRAWSARRREDVEDVVRGAIEAILDNALDEIAEDLHFEQSYVDLPSATHAKLANASKDAMLKRVRRAVEDALWTR